MARGRVFLLTGRPGRRRLLVGVVVLAFTATAVVSLDSAASATSANHARTAALAPAAERSAIAEAVATGVRVPIPSETTETAQVFAEPTGELTAEQTVVPTRVRSGDSWVPVDTTLKLQTDGTVRPTATVVDLSFSGGGTSTAPLTKLTRAGMSLALSWPSALPKPVLSGDTATYPEILPGVDLKVRALADGMSEVLVVKTATAAKQSALKALKFKTQTVGSSVAADSGGGFNLVDAEGNPVLQAPQPLMWDSTGLSTTSLSSTGSEGPNARAPQGPNRTAKMKVQLGAGSLTLTPDSTLLSSSSAKYPLYLDPMITLPGDMQMWGMVDGYTPGRQVTPYSKWGNGTPNSPDGGEGMGWINTSGGALKRLIFQFNVSRFLGSHISAAIFKAYEVKSYYCGGSTKPEVRAYIRTQMSTSTTWAHQPADLYMGGGPNYATAHANNRIGCNPGGGWVEFGVQPMTQYVLDHYAPTSHLETIVLEAPDDVHLGTHANATFWKRFLNNAVLSVSYNHAPDVPTVISTSSPTTSCVDSTDPNQIPAIPNDPPLLHARISDVDGPQGQKVSAIFEVWKGDGSAKVYAPGAVPSGAFLPSGSDIAMQVPDNVLSDGSYEWRVLARDDALAYSGFSRWCRFTVDTHAPNAEPAVSWTGPPSPHTNFQVGDTTTLTISNNGVSDVDSYAWSVNSDVPKASYKPGDPSPVVTLASSGTNVIRVWSYDRARNQSPAATVLLTTTGSTVSGRWKLNESSGTTAADALASDPITLSSGVTRMAGAFAARDASDLAVHFDGTTSGATTVSNVVKTNDNFTVAAWVHLTDLTTRQVAVSADGPASSVFTLGYVPAQGSIPAGFAFTMFDPNAAATVKEVVAQCTDPSCSAPTTTGWYRVVGSYEAGTHVLTLYVNASNRGMATAKFAPPSTSGVLRLARGQSAGAAAWPWHGDVDDVQVLRGAVDQADVNTLQTYQPLP